MFCCFSPDLYCFFFNGTATTEIYTLSLHDALPISRLPALPAGRGRGNCGRTAGGGSCRHGDPPLAVRAQDRGAAGHLREPLDRKSTRLNSSHSQISYAVFCLKKKKKQRTNKIL